MREPFPRSIGSAAFGPPALLQRAVRGVPARILLLHSRVFNGTTH